MQPLAVHHVAINVDDVDEAIAFYTKTLGLTQRTDRPDFGFPGAWLDAGGSPGVRQGSLRQRVRAAPGQLGRRVPQRFAAVLVFALPFCLYARPAASASRLVTSAIARVEPSPPYPPAASRQPCGVTPSCLP